ncbi:XRE family transcriptional regulator [Puteibacter caeruleilacunae]|nr:XRE family transcriptional regulator [Puteibacter caeruleilacunae]
MEERIKILLDKEKLTAAEFADYIDVQRPSVSHVLSGRNKPSFIFIQKILARFPQLNSRWLMLGEEPMYMEQGSEPTDLFTPQENRQPVKVAEQHSITDTASDKIGQEKMTKNGRSKEIEKILVFYTDNTFEEFKPR